MCNHNKAQQSKNRVHISWDILYMQWSRCNSFEDWAPVVKSTGTQPSNELQWLDLKIGYQDDSPRNDQNFDIPYKFI